MASLHHLHHLGEEQELEEHHSHGEEEDENESSPSRRGRKREASMALRKNPEAPKRFKSSYICFFMAKQSVIKEELGEDATVAAVSKRSAEMWKTLTTNERAHWDEVAAKDKQRYMVEKASYTGPWQVPYKRARKDPSAPKRPMSAFLLFSQGRRSQIKLENPGMKNTEISRLLGEMWRNASEEDRRPHIEKEKAEREKYKVAIAEWRAEHEAKQEAQRKQQAEQLAAMAVPNVPDLQAAPPAQPSFGEPFPVATMPPPPGYNMYQGYPPYPPPATYYQFPINGKQPVVLGPSGTPHYSQSFAVPPQGPIVTAPPMQQQQQQAPAPGYQPPPSYDDGQGGEAHYDYSPTDQGEPQTAE